MRAASPTPVRAGIWPKPQRRPIGPPQTALSRWSPRQAAPFARGAAATATRAGVNGLRREKGGILNADDLARICNAISEAKAQADVVLAYHHNHLLEQGGRQTPLWQRLFARQCIDAGASLYVSLGAPRLQATPLSSLERATNACRIWP
jgi:poly-gamma-glutamate capsule biosynthesis protein CapA/YwtB (metallophosphatase superfamily)